MTKAGFDEKTLADFDNRFGHHEAGAHVEQMKSVKKAIRLAATIICKNLPESAGREQACALTKLEEAMFWAVTGIARQVPSTETKFREEKQMSELAIIAEACHEANRAYCISIGDETQVPWDEAPEWQKESAKNGVKAFLFDPAMTLEDLHNKWMDDKIADGWIYGPEKNAELKTHYCLVPYAQLPEEQKKKDEIFRGVILDIITKR